MSREEWRHETLGYARMLQRISQDMGEHSQFGALSLWELIDDRDQASVPRMQRVWPRWAVEGEGVSGGWGHLGNVQNLNLST